MYVCLQKLAGGMYVFWTDIPPPPQVRVGMSYKNATQVAATFYILLATYFSYSYSLPEGGDS